MQNVYDLAHELSRSLKETDQFKDYMRLKAEIDANESLKKIVDDFTALSMQVESGLITGQTPDPELSKKLQTTYTIVMQDPTCANYINAEMAFSTILSDIYKIIGEALE